MFRPRDSRLLRALGMTLAISSAIWMLAAWDVVVFRWVGAGGFFVGLGIDRLGCRFSMSDEDWLEERGISPE